MVKATQKPQDAVEFAWDSLTRNCIWGVNEGFDSKRHGFHRQYGRDRRRHRSGERLASIRWSTCRSPMKAVEAAAADRDRQLQGLRRALMLRELRPQAGSFARRSRRLRADPRRHAARGRGRGLQGPCARSMIGVSVTPPNVDAYDALYRQGAWAVRQALHRCQHHPVRRGQSPRRWRRSPRAPPSPMSRCRHRAAPKAVQIWDAPRMPAELQRQRGRKSATDLKGKNCSAPPAAASAAINGGWVARLSATAIS